MEDDSINIKRPQRWDVPFWSEGVDEAALEMTTEDVTRLMQIPLLSQMDESRFPESTSLRDILLNDARLRKFKKGNIVVRQGDYGNSAFIILSGTLRVVLDTLDPSVMGRQEPEQKSFFDALAQLWRNPSQPEVRNLSRKNLREPGKTDFVTREETAIFVQDVSAIIRDKRTAELRAGELFGEIAALSRTPRTTTVVADSETELLEIRWQGLREIRLRSPEFRDYVDKLYRERSLKTHLRETTMFKHLDDATLDKVAAATEFLTFGNFDWYGAYTKLREITAAERIQREPVVAHEGHYANGVYLIRSGFARLSETYNHGERTVSYLGRGQTFGFEEVSANWRDHTQTPFQRSLRALGYVDVLFVPTQILEQYVLPNLPAFQKTPEPLKKEHPLKPPVVSGSRKVSPEMMEFLVDHRFINGTATMMIDMDRCTRCDDCVRACASTHNNNPRFVRHGPVSGGFMIANSCMHCQDPVCMIGCPTGAIHRDSAHGRVVINDSTCIGCATCANSCPYDNIQMVFARETNGGLYYDKATNQPIQKAAKCDLCATQITGPACANACPHDAMIRVDMRDVDTLAEWLGKK
ncbi:MAG: cyclic nucleotide-binding domain-containing protein [Verrucomicrobiota bacterium]